MSTLRCQIQLPRLHACMVCSGTGDEDCMCPWIESLPEEVPLPLFQYSEADLEACQDTEVIREAKCIRESAQAVYQVLTAYCSCPAKLACWCSTAACDKAVRRLAKASPVICKTSTFHRRQSYESWGSTPVNALFCQSVHLQVTHRVKGAALSSAG